MGYGTRRLVAARSMVYATRQLYAGDAFDAPEIDALYLVRTKRATDAFVQEPAKADDPPIVDVVEAPAEADQLPDLPTEVSSPRRRYVRRSAVRDADSSEA